MINDSFDSTTSSQNGFSKILNKETFLKKFPDDNMIFDYSDNSFQLREGFQFSYNDSINYLSKKVEAFLLSKKVISSNGEKILYLPLFLLIQTPVFLTNLNIETIVEERENNYNEDNENDNDDYSRNANVKSNNILIHHESTIRHTKQYPKGNVEFIIKEEEGSNRILLIIEVKPSIHATSQLKANGIWQLLAEMRVGLYISGTKIIYGILTSLYSFVFVKMELIEETKPKNKIKITLSPYLEFIDSNWNSTIQTPLVLSYLFDILSTYSTDITSIQDYFAKFEEAEKFNVKRKLEFMHCLEQAAEALEIAERAAKREEKLKKKKKKLQQKVKKLQAQLNLQQEAITRETARKKKRKREELDV